MNIEYTCIKGKSKGNYIVATEEKPEPTPSVVYPEIDTPDFDYPVEIDYPDYDTDYGLCSESMFGANDQSNDQSVDLEIDSLDFESIVDEVKKDIASQKFLDKSQHYMELLKVDRQEFDDYLIYEFDAEELIGTDDEELIFDMDVKVDEVRVFDRLFSLYCQDNAFVIPAKTNHHLRQWLDRLDKDYRYFPKKQLNIFGEV